MPAQAGLTMRSTRNRIAHGMIAFGGMILALAAKFAQPSHDAFWPIVMCVAFVAFAAGIVLAIRWRE